MVCEGADGASERGPQHGRSGLSPGTCSRPARRLRLRQSWRDRHAPQGLGPRHHAVAKARETRAKDGRNPAEYRACRIPARQLCRRDLAAGLRLALPAGFAAVALPSGTLPGFLETVRGRDTRARAIVAGKVWRRVVSLFAV